MMFLKIVFGGRKFSVHVFMSVLSMLLFWAIAGWVVARECGEFKSLPTNGAFQLFNPLVRMAQGQTVGVDFDFFHGSGTLYLHYPLFVLLGGDLLASELSRKLTSPLVYLLCFHLWACAWRIPGYIASVCATMVVVIGVFLEGSGAFAGNSMVGLRSATAVLVLPTALLMARCFPLIKKPLPFGAILGLGLGFSMFVATEQGLVAIVWHGLWIISMPLMAVSFLRRVGWASLTGALAVAAFIFFNWAGSGGHLVEALQFSLSDIPQEQFWYFGAPPNLIPEWPSALWRFSTIVGFWMPVALCLVEIIWLVRCSGKGPVGADSFFVFFLLGYAVTVQIPHLAAYSHYHIVATRNMGLVGMLWIWRICLAVGFRWPTVVGNVRNARVPAAFSIAFLVFGVLGIGSVIASSYSMAQDRASQVRHGRMDLSYGWAADLKVWEEIGFPGAKVAGTYRALVESREQSDFLGPDYIIHALGSRRAGFLKNLEAYDPDFFLTLNQDFGGFEEWVQLRHWDVYQYLIRAYDPVMFSDYHLFWRRKATDDRSLVGKMLPVARKGNVWLSSSHSGSRCLYTVSVRYTVRNPMESAPIVGKFTRYLLSRDVVSVAGVDSRLPVSLPPAESEWRFPMVLSHGESARLSMSMRMAFPSNGSHVTSVLMEEVSRDPKVINGIVGGGLKPSKASFKD
jgi:hypothetical protein